MALLFSLLMMVSCASAPSRPVAATLTRSALNLRAVDVTHSTMVAVANERFPRLLDDFYDRYGYPIPEGDWLAVALEVTNTGAKGMRLTASDFTLRPGAGRRFAAAAWPRDPEEHMLAPGATLTLRLKFDGAPAVAQGRVILYRGAEPRTIYLD